MCQAALGSPHFHLLLQLETGTLLSDLAIIFLALCNNLFYTQLAFVFHLQKEFYIVHDNSSVRFWYLSQAYWRSFEGSNNSKIPILLRKRQIFFMLANYLLINLMTLINSVTGVNITATLKNLLCVKLITLVCMKYDCHIFSKYLELQMKNLVFQSKYLAFRWRT